MRLTTNQHHTGLCLLCLTTSTTQDYACSALYFPAGLHLWPPKDPLLGVQQTWVRQSPCLLVIFKPAPYNPCQLLLRGPGINPKSKVQ